jgi:hypothetical protein
VKTATFLVSCVVAVALVATYVALGGTSYEPTPVANPCAPRAHREPSGTDERLQLVVLAAADAAACRLGVSREELVLALRSTDELDQLAAEKGKSRDELEEALRDGLVRAVGQSEDEGLIGDTTAGALRFAAEHLPLGLLLDLLRRGSSLLG